MVGAQRCNMSPDTRTAQYTLYAILDEPYCLWDWDVQARAREFLDGIDHGYFEYLALQGQRLVADPAHGLHSAAAMRLGYFHGAETLFLLIGAFIQAPHAPQAFVSECWPAQLRKLLTRLSVGPELELVCWGPPPMSWDLIARIVCAGSHVDASKIDENVELFAAFWRRLAAEYLDELQIEEHNSLKHGFRVAHYGVSIDIGPPGVQQPDESQFTSLGGSRFGTSYTRLETVPGAGDSRRSRTSRRVVVNWSPQSMALALQLIACSINNVVSALKLRNGAAPSTVQFRRFTSNAAFTKPWEVAPAVHSLVLPAEIVVAKPRTKSELLQEWRQRVTGTYGKPSPNRGA